MVSISNMLKHLLSHDWLRSLDGFQFLVTSWLSSYSLLCQPVDYSTSPLAMRVRVDIPHISLCI